MKDNVTPKQMIRLKDGEVMAYSRTLVAAHPGEFAPARWDKEKKVFVKVGDRTLVEVPPPAADTGVIPDDFDDEPKGEDWADPAPEIDGAEEAAAPQAPPKRKRVAKKRAAQAG